MNAQSSERLIDGPAGVLAGTLEGGAADQAALILPGSGPTDRDGNQRAGGLLTDSYRLLAEALAAEGLPTLRIDKRGLGGSGGDGNAVSLAAYRADAAAWVEDLRAETGAACVWLIGHSEGGLIAMASADLPNVCGLILLATPGRGLGEILIEQLSRNPQFAGDMEAIEAVIGDLAAGRDPDISALPLALAALFGPATRAYLAELIRTDTADLARRVSVPTLAIWGDADIQVAAGDAALMQTANPAFDVGVLPGLTHTLKQVEAGDMTASLATYADPALPLHDQLLAEILAFVQGR